MISFFLIDDRQFAATSFSATFDSVGDWNFVRRYVSPCMACMGIFVAFPAFRLDGVSIQAFRQFVWGGALSFSCWYGLLLDESAIGENRVLFSGEGGCI